MTDAATALLDELIDRFADRVADRLGAREPQIEPWLTVAEAADHLRCTTSRIYSLVSARRIPFCKDGSRVLFRRAELDEYVRAGGGKVPS